MEGGDFGDLIGSVNGKRSDIDVKSRECGDIKTKAVAGRCQSVHNMTLEICPRIYPRFEGTKMEGDYKDRRDLSAAFVKAGKFFACGCAQIKAAFKSNHNTTEDVEHKENALGNNILKESVSRTNSQAILQNVNNSDSVKRIELRTFIKKSKTSEKILYRGRNKAQLRVTKSVAALDSTKAFGTHKLQVVTSEVNKEKDQILAGKSFSGTDRVIHCGDEEQTNKLNLKEGLGNIFNFLPETKEDFQKFSSMISEMILGQSKSPFYVDCVQDLLANVLPTIQKANDIKKFKKLVGKLFMEKIKAEQKEKEDERKKMEKKRKPKLYSPDITNPDDVLDLFD